MSSSFDSETMQAAAMIGRNVMVAGSSLQLTDAGAVAGLQLDGFADKVTVTVKDSNGLAVRTLNLGDLDAGLNNYTWDGLTNTGAKAVNGSYGIDVEATRAGIKVGATALQLSTVQSVTRSSSGLTIDVGSLGKLSMADIKQIF
jgi:flagellar basal-body rod modification protein FlgD